MREEGACLRVVVAARQVQVFAMQFRGWLDLASFNKSKNAQSDGGNQAIQHDFHLSLDTRDPRYTDTSSVCLAQGLGCER